MNERDFFEERDNRPAYSDFSGSEGVELVPVSPGPLITPAEDWQGQSADYTYPSVYQEAPTDGADVAGGYVARR